MIYAADFETLNEINDCRVWAWGVCDIYNLSSYTYGTTIDSFISYVRYNKGNHTYYFHNLAWDGEFLISWLLNNGYCHIKDRSECKSKTFITLISDLNVFYAIEIYFYVNGDVKKVARFYDSMKLYPNFSIDKIGKTFGFKEQKLTIDYNKYRSKDHELTEDEIEYLKHDVIILARALKFFYDQNLKKMTIASNALYYYKNITGKKRFEYLYPNVICDKFVRKTYKGGYTYLNPKYIGKDIGSGIVLDVNSLYPYVMYSCNLPYGDPIYYSGKYQYDKEYNLYVQHLRCQFELRTNYLPTLQIKHSLSFVPTEYLSSSDGEIVDLYLTNVDLEIFLEHYDVYDVNYIEGYKFKSSNILFKKYIDYWYKIKEESTLTGNSGMRTLSKLMLNSLYGKFGLKPIVASKYPIMGDDDIVHYKTSAPEERKPIYIPIATFITANARSITIQAAQQMYDRFIYADTDSLHLIGTDIPDLDISDTDLGSWKIENEFSRARFLKQKTYIEEINGEFKITCSGLPSQCYPYVTWENFKVGAEYPGKLKRKRVKGGVILYESPHTIR